MQDKKSLLVNAESENEVDQVMIDCLKNVIPDIDEAKNFLQLCLNWFMVEIGSKMHQGTFISSL